MTLNLLKDPDLELSTGLGELCRSLLEHFEGNEEIAARFLSQAAKHLKHWATLKQNQRNEWKKILTSKN